MTRLEVLVGTIASGKSTYCKHRAKDGAIIVNDDALVTALHGGDYKLYSKSLKPMYRAIEQGIMLNGLLLDRDVVIDRPNLTKDSRAKYLALAKAMEFETTIILFPFQEPKVHALRRAQDDMRGYTFEYWRAVAEHQIKQYEPPEVGECDTIDQMVFE